MKQCTRPLNQAVERMSWKHEEKLTHVGAVGMTAEATQTLWAV